MVTYHNFAQVSFRENIKLDRKWNMIVKFNHEEKYS